VNYEQVPKRPCMAIYWQSNYQKYKILASTHGHDGQLGVGKKGLMAGHGCQRLTIHRQRMPTSGHACQRVAMHANAYQRVATRANSSVLTFFLLNSTFCPLPTAIPHEQVNWFTESHPQLSKCLCLHFHFSSHG
jgi:hypothetical protein